jgi:hypothetical protein
MQLPVPIKKGISWKGKFFKDIIKYLAIDWKYWTIYYSYYALEGILPTIYLQHWNKFVLCMIMLCQYKMPKKNLPIIHRTLTEFVAETGSLYGAEAIRINIHQLLHLTNEDVIFWGLLWTHNTFIYESMNGHFVKLIHGTQLVPKAAVHAINTMQQMTLKEFNIKFINKEANALFEKFQQNSKR